MPDGLPVMDIYNIVFLNPLLGFVFPKALSESGFGKVVVVRVFESGFQKVSFGKVVPVRVFQNSGPESGPEFETRRTRVGSTWLCGQKCNG